MNWLVRKPQQTAPAIVTVDDWLTGTGDGRRDADFYRDAFHPDPTQAITCPIMGLFPGRFHGKHARKWAKYSGGIRPRVERNGKAGH